MGAPGCDDAPKVSVALTERNRIFTLIMPYYENPAFFEHQLLHWAKLPYSLTSMMRIIIVDDGSPVHPAAEVLEHVHDDTLTLRLFRIGVDVRWNWLAARNIGAYHADTHWIMMTDMDHMIPEATLRTLVWGDHKSEIIYRFSRVGTKTHPHPNSWFMTRDMFWKVGGYDEALSGYYGTDGEYRRRCAATAPIRIMDVALELHEHEGDASTIAYKRKQPEDAAGKRLIKSRRPGWKPKVLSFPYAECIFQ